MNERARRGRSGWGAVLLVLVVAITAGCAWFLFETAPEQEKVVPRREAPIVDVVRLAAATQDVTAEAFGTVVPAREVALAPQVSGRVVAIAAALTPGGLVSAGELLFEVERADYELAVDQAEAELEQTRADLELELGRRQVAEREWERFGPELETLGDEGERARSRALALREPQLRRMRALVSAAETHLAQARLELARTTVAAPFDAVVLEESVEVGLIVRSGETVVRLVGTDQFWIQASLRADLAARLAEAGRDLVRIERPSAVSSSHPGAVLEGRLLRVLADLEPEGRMARVLVAVEDPLGLRPSEEVAGRRAASLPLGSYVRLELPAGSLTDVFRVPREALRENDRLWLVGDDGRLRVREVDVVWRGPLDVLLRAEVAEDERLVASYLSSPLPGMELRVRDVSGAEAPE